MALQKQTITIPLGLGINTKTDEKLVEQGAFNLVCENATFEKVGAVKKRQSYKSLSTTYYNPNEPEGSGSGTYTALTYKPTCLAVLNKSAFLRNQQGEYLYSHNDDFVYKNDYPIPECKINSKRVYSPATSVYETDCDFDSNENIILAAARNEDYGNDEGTSALVIYDYEKQSSITSEEVSNAGGSAIFGPSRAGWTRVAGASYYYHIYSNSNDVLEIQVFNKYGQTYTTLSQSSVLANNDIAVARNSATDIFYIIVPTTTANTGRFIALSADAITVNTTFTFTGTGWDSATARYNTSTGKIDFAYVASGSGRSVIFNTSGTVSTADASLSGLNSAQKIAYHKDNDYITVNGTSDNLSTYITATNIQTLENSYTSALTDAQTLSGITFLVTSNDMEGYGVERNYFFQQSLVTNSGTRVFGRFYEGQAPANSGKQIARSAKISATVTVSAVPYFAGYDGINAVYHMALVFAEINQDYKSNSRIKLGENLHFSGGFLTEFDGEKLFENGFHLKCPTPTVTLISAAGNLTGVYRYVGVLRYTDKNGQVSRSQPSDVVTTSTAAADWFQVDMISVPFGVKAVSCVVEIYRTQSGGSSFNLCLEIPVNMYSSGFAWPVASVIDNNSDASISNNTILYTSGGVLENNPGRAASHVFQGGNRVFCVGLNDENEMSYSKKKLFAESVNFNDNQIIRFDSAQFNTLGGLTAGAYMDGKIIGFKRNSILYIAGDGPLETGLQNTFTDPELISSETGCTEPRSVVLTPAGVMFKGEKGIYLLDRGMNTQYIGSSVEEFNSFNVVSACHVDKKNQVIFSIISSNASEKYQLAYDYFTQQWSLTKNIRALDADIIDGDHVILSASNNTPYVNNGDDFFDDSASYSVRVKTPWIKVSGIQDFGRIWSVEILGKFKSAHTLRVIAYYDYETSYSETYDITPLVSDSQYQYRCHLRKQKCEAVQFEIQDLDQAGTGESMELSAITLEVGLRKGSFKLPASRKY
jgi:hypothetical protein